LEKEKEMLFKKNLRISKIKQLKEEKVLIEK
jgi:hypothetical protein